MFAVSLLFLLYHNHDFMCLERKISQAVLCYEKPEDSQLKPLKVFHTISFPN